MVRYLVHWPSLRRPLSPSRCIFWMLGTTIAISWTTIEAEMYGMMPSPKTDALLNAPPENMSNSAISPPRV